MPKPVITGQLQHHWEIRKIPIQISSVKSQQKQLEPPQPHLAVPKHKVTGPRAPQHPQVRAGSGQVNYAAEAQDQKQGISPEMGTSRKANTLCGQRLKQKPRPCRADPTPLRPRAESPAQAAAAAQGGAARSAPAPTASRLYPYAKHHIYTSLYESTLNNPYKEGDKTKTKHVSQFPQRFLHHWEVQEGGIM